MHKYTQACIHKHTDMCVSVCVCVPKHVRCVCVFLVKHVRCVYVYIAAFINQYVIQQWLFENFLNNSGKMWGVRINGIH